MGPTNHLGGGTPPLEERLQPELQHCREDNDSFVSVEDVRLSSAHPSDEEDEEGDVPSSTVATSTSSMTIDSRSKKTRVSFSTVQIHHHLIILGDNPGALNRGPPLSISWKAFDTIILSVDDYEGTMTTPCPPRRRPLTQLLVPSKQRHSILMGLGYSRGEIREATLAVEQVKILRRRTNQQRRWDQTHAHLETISRKVHRCITLGGRIKRPEHDWLHPTLPSQQKQQQPHQPGVGSATTQRFHNTKDLFADTSQRSSTSTGTTTTAATIDLSESFGDVVRSMESHTILGVVEC